MSVRKAFDIDIFDGSGTNGNNIFDTAEPVPVKGNVILAYLHDPTEESVEAYVNE